MKKYKCSCGLIWFTDDPNPVCNSTDDEYTGMHNHIVKETKALSGNDYAVMWAIDLESANRHSITDMPDEILDILDKYIENKNIVNEIMKNLYQKQIGL